MVDDDHVERRSVGANQLQGFFGAQALGDLTGDLAAAQRAAEGQPVVLIVFDQENAKR